MKVYTDYFFLEMIFQHDYWRQFASEHEHEEAHQKGQEEDEKDWYFFQNYYIFILEDYNFFQENAQIDSQTPSKWPPWKMIRQVFCYFENAHFSLSCVFSKVIPPFK